MSAIAGILSLDQGQVEAEPAERMAASMAWRGPDDEGSYRSPDGRVALAARRLAALDDSAEAGLPLANETHDVWLVLDGEVLNHRALRHSLELVGHRFRSGSDTEVALHAYEQWSLDFLKHLQGAFALALWDDRRDRLVLARDRMGRKPLYLAEYRGRLAFGSSIRPLLDQLGLPRRIDPLAFVQHLALGWVAAPRTLVSGIAKLGPGEMMVAERGSAPVRRVWGSSLPEERRATAIRALPSERQCGNLRTLLECSIADRMMGDGRVAVRLDPSTASGVIAATMSRLAGRRTLAVTVLGSDHLDGTEARAARALAGAAHCDMTEIAVSGDEAAAAVPGLVTRLSEPTGDAVGLLTWLAAGRAGREGVTALLAADGAEEVLLDRTVYDPMRRAPRFGLLRRWVPTFARSFFGSDAPPPTSVLTTSAPLGEFGWEEMLGPAVKGTVPSPPDSTESSLPRWLMEDPLAAAGWIDLAWRGAESLCPATDSSALAHGIQCRLPFLDEIVVSYASAVPGQSRAPTSPRKQMLRRLATSVLPLPIAGLTPAGNFLPLNAWMRGPLGAAVERAVGGCALFRNGLLSAELTRTILREHQRNGASGPALWAILILAEWCEAVGLEDLAGWDAFQGPFAQTFQSRS